jgi:hypothetical protein
MGERSSSTPDAPSAPFLSDRPFGQTLPPPRLGCFSGSSVDLQEMGSWLVIYLYPWVALQGVIDHADERSSPCGLSQRAVDTPEERYSAQSSGYGPGRQRTWRSLRSSRWAGSRPHGKGGQPRLWQIGQLCRGLVVTPDALLGEFVAYSCSTRVRGERVAVPWAELARAECVVPGTLEDVAQHAKAIRHRKRAYWIMVLTARSGESSPSLSPIAVRGIVGPNVPVYFLKRRFATHLSSLLPEGAYELIGLGYPNDEARVQRG